MAMWGWPGLALIQHNYYDETQHLAITSDVHYSKVYIAYFFLAESRSSMRIQDSSWKIGNSKI